MDMALGRYYGKSSSSGRNIKKIEIHSLLDIYNIIFENSIIVMDKEYVGKDSPGQLMHRCFVKKLENDGTFSEYCVYAFPEYEFELYHASTIDKIWNTFLIEGGFSTSRMRISLFVPNKNTIYLMNWIDSSKISYTILNSAANAFMKEIYMLQQESKEEKNIHEKEK